MDSRPGKRVSLNKPEEVDKHLAQLPENIRTSLEEVRKIIREIVPDATERVSYRIPIFRINRDLVGFGSKGTYCSFYAMSPELVRRMKEELKGYEVSGATIHFTPDKPLSRELIEKIVKSRLEEIRQQS